MTEAGPELERWLAGARAGDADASRALVEALYPLVIRIVRGHRPVRLAEEDLAQEVFVKLFARLDRYEAQAGVPFEHWVSRLTVRTCLDALRAERRRPELRCSDLGDEENQWLEFLLNAAAPPPETPDTSAAEAVEHLLAQLSPDDRWVIRLLDLEQKSVAEISQLTGWSRPAVKVRAFRARHRLRLLLRPPRRRR
jgi:RNA polymerase sigma-70 factor (ECF subfamily)